MLRRGIFKNFFQRTEQLLSGGKAAEAGTPITEELFENLEEALLGADMSLKTTERVVKTLRESVERERLPDAESVRERLRQTLLYLLGNPGENRLRLAPTPPTVYLVVGVNGVGKTTTIAKLAASATRHGRKVVLAAGDTFRAAAADQLGIWAERVGADLVRQKEGADPAAVVFDAISAAKSREADIVIVDTAGRLHNKKNLMQELAKIGRITDRELGHKPDDVLLVLDATTGQNAIRQAKEFLDAVDVTGIVLAKLDGTARGGIVVTIRQELGIPIKLVGTGEKPEDLRAFNPEEFVDALLATD